MDLNEAGASRLRDEQIRAIDETTEQLNQLQTYLDDYVALGNRLRTLPDKVTHDVMVPFGKFAFMPGQLVHTNEIQVLLGDNWFADRSAKQAAEITSRRVEALKSQMGDLEKQKSLLQPRLGFTSELQDMMQESSGLHEIQEMYDPETEETWREHHRENVRVHKRAARAQREQAIHEEVQQASTQSLDTHPHTDPSNDNMTISNAAIWERLDELEMQERRNREMARLGDPANETSVNELPSQFAKSVRQASDSSTRVRWKDQPTGLANVRSSSSGSETDDSEDDTCPPRPTTISFTHSEVSSHQTSSHSDQEGAPLVLSPADIYTQFSQSQSHPPKSILKHPSTQFTEHPSQPQEPRRVHQVERMAAAAAGDPEPFTGEVHEQSIPETATDKHSQPSQASQHSQPSLAHTDRTNDEPAKRVSRFKARQMKKKS